jgi:hypothetical protein
MELPRASDWDGTRAWAGCFENIGTRAGYQKGDPAKQQNPADKDPGPSSMPSPNHQHPLFLTTVNA